MTRTVRPVVSALGAIVMSLFLTFAVSTSAFAADSSGAALPMGLCTTSANAVVAVDFAHWGGPIVRSCGSTPTSGFDLVNEGGFHTVGTQHDGPGFICRISSSSFGGTAYPRANEPGEACVLTPPATGYWAYWHADAGQNSWSYSSTGATEYSPKPGSVDLWVFGGTTTPSFSPNAVRATNAEPTVATTTHDSTARPSSAGRSSSAPSRASRPSSASAPGTQTTAPRTTLARTSPTRTSPTRTTAPTSGTSSSGSRSATTPAPTVPSAGGSGSDPAGSPAVIDAAPTAAGHGSSGSIWPVFIAIVVAALLATGAGLTVLRRRSS